jgi:putative ABC transport system permease protein
VKIRISLRTRKVLRDIWGSKARTLLVVVSIAVGLLAMSTVFRARTILAREIEQSLAASNPAGAAILTPPVGGSAVDVARRTKGVEEAQGRRVEWGRIKAGESGEWRSMKLVALDGYEDMQVNRIVSESGACRTASCSSSVPACLLSAWRSATRSSSRPPTGTGAGCL